MENNPEFRMFSPSLTGSQKKCKNPVKYSVFPVINQGLLTNPDMLMPHLKKGVCV